MPVAEGKSGGGVFATTHWSIVAQAGAEASPVALAAINTLCQGYWFPIYAHIRRFGHGAEEARDLTQEFFASLLRHESVARVRREQGRFRTFLLASLSYFLADQSDRARAAKRGGGVPPVELDALEGEARLALEPATHESPDVVFDRRWIAVLIERSLLALQVEQGVAGRARQFELLKPFLEHPAERGEYERVAEALGLNPNAVAAAVRRLRLRLRELLLIEVSHTVGTLGEAEDELRQLLA